MTGKYNDYDRPIKVVLACTAEWVNEKEVEVTDINEDAAGRDWLTFVCPRCGREHESFRYSS
jgi:hypothetical protein